MRAAGNRHTRKCRIEWSKSKRVMEHLCTYSVHINLGLSLENVTTFAYVINIFSKSRMRAAGNRHRRKCRIKWSKSKRVMEHLCTYYVHKCFRFSAVWTAMASIKAAFCSESQTVHGDINKTHASNAKELFLELSKNCAGRCYTTKHTLHSTLAKNFCLLLLLLLLLHYRHERLAGVIALYLRLQLLELRFRLFGFLSEVLICPRTDQFKLQLFLLMENNKNRHFS